MVGQSSGCLNISECYRYFCLSTGIIILLYLLLGAVATADPESTVRLVVYSSPNDTIGYNPIPPDVSLPPNLTYSLRSSSLGFIVVETRPNETEYMTNELLNLPWVFEVEPDAPRISGSISKDETITNISPDQWAFSRMGVNIPNNKINVSPCTVAIIDTGVDYTHKDLRGIGRGYDWVSQDSRPEDSDGHGTALSGIVSVIAGKPGSNASPKNTPPLTIIPERIGKDGNTMYGSLSALAIGHAAENGADIILMGYGGTQPSLAEERAISYAVQKGCLLIASAGNEDSNTMHYPSDNFEVISVGSIAKSDGLSYFSNYGIYIELVAPGEEIISTCHNNSYCKGFGTSFAAAEVAGVAAYLLESYPLLSSSDIRTILQTSATDLGRVGRDIYYGYGVVTLPKALETTEKFRLQKTLQEFSVGNMTKELRRNGSPRNSTLYSLSLVKGWNFISIPAPLMSGKTCRELFSKVNTDSHTIWSYTGTDNGWMPHQPDETLTPLNGTLVYTDNPVSIPLVLDTSKNVTRNLTKGWNLVGLPVLTDVSARNLTVNDKSAWISILPFNATMQRYDPAIINGATGRYADTRDIQPFTSFWIYLDSDNMSIRPGDS